MVDQNQARQAILTEALNLVPFEGWTDKTLKESSKSAGFDEKYGYILFPEGISDLVGYFIQDCDAHMLDGVKSLPLKDMRVRDRIAATIKIRIQNHIPHKQAIPATLRFFALPQHSIQGTKALAHTASEIWYAAGDKSTDFNYYSKRFLLAGVYTSTLLFWLDDHSEGYKDTWEFLDRRIDNVLQIGKLKEKYLGCFPKWRTNNP